jgi:hypothetical protein
MTNWLFIGGMMFLVFVAKCIKEIIDVRAMRKMTKEYLVGTLERRNFYDNHA